MKLELGEGDFDHENWTPLLTDDGRFVALVKREEDAVEIMRAINAEDKFFAPLVGKEIVVTFNANDATWFRCKLLWYNDSSLCVDVPADYDAHRTAEQNKTDRWKNAHRELLLRSAIRRVSDEPHRRLIRAI